jgi:hypothetical protein
MHWSVKVVIVLIVMAAGLAIACTLLARKPVPQEITYGMSFNTLYARELGLDWKETYDAILDDLRVRHLRLAAHWPMIEPQKDVYTFSEMDYQLARANEVGAKVILGVGRRLPRWPECHVPSWAKGLTWEEQQQEILDYMTLVVERYKGNDAITHWQVENEPFLEVFATEHCGVLDEAFLEKEIALVRTLDPSRPILVTDSGNLGTWAGAFKHGDAFGTSVYIYFWNPELGQFRTVLPPWAYRIKENVMKLLYGDKQTFLIELSAEPWLLEPIIDTSLETQYSRMDIEKFEDILTYAKDTRYDLQYLWGAEWWYWLMQKGDPSFWDKGKELF